MFLEPWISEVSGSGNPQSPSDDIELISEVRVVAPPVPKVPAVCSLPLSSTSSLPVLSSGSLHVSSSGSGFPSASRVQPGYFNVSTARTLPGNLPSPPGNVSHGSVRFPMARETGVPPLSSPREQSDVSRAPMDPPSGRDQLSRDFMLGYQLPYQNRAQEPHNVTTLSRDQHVPFRPPQPQYRHQTQGKGAGFIYRPVQPQERVQTQTQVRPTAPIRPTIPPPKTATKRPRPSLQAQGVASKQLKSCVYLARRGVKNNVSRAPPPAQVSPVNAPVSAPSTTNRQKPVPVSGARQEVVSTKIASANDDLAVLNRTDVNLDKEILLKALSNATDAKGSEDADVLFGSFFVLFSGFLEVYRC